MSQPRSRRPRVDNRPRTLESIMNDRTITAPAAVVPGLVMQFSVTLLYAREKVGKTTFITWLMKQLAMGNPIFGASPKMEVVLYCSLEESLHLVKMRAHEMDIAKKAPIHVLRSVRDETKSPLKLLEDSIVETGATVVVIDSLSAYTLGAARGNSPEAWNEALYPLSQMASAQGCSLIIVHHANKGKSEDFRGSTAIGAAVDIIAHLTKPTNEQPNVRRISYTGRYGTGQIFVDRDDATGDYRLADAAEAPTATARGAVTDAQIAERLVSARKVEGGVTKDQLRKAGGVKGVRTDAIAERLVAEGRLAKKKVHGGYRFAAAA
ncbi:MAG: AAA family ATPase [Gemmatimonadaceae bacterium]|nr:AAA family ATPase [Gemmatimonadaceae bacterium]